MREKQSDWVLFKDYVAIVLWIFSGYINKDISSLCVFMLLDIIPINRAIHKNLDQIFVTQFWMKQNIYFIKFSDLKA